MDSSFKRADKLHTGRFWGFHFGVLRVSSSDAILTEADEVVLGEAGARNHDDGDGKKYHYYTVADTWLLNWQQKLLDDRFCLIALFDSL